MATFFHLNENTWINRDMIRWAEKQDNGCFNVCSKQTGCGYGDTQKICPNSPDYRKFMTYLGIQKEKTSEDCSYGVVVAKRE